ncbi:MAG TPA: sugar-transfer associated ATP-grasp domain-containing protein [Candidatus Fimivivens sp.]|nr:sugar-transfer associated ATP-grasp domain-containing protein [Candidatus Fimivivens sp.]
MFELLRNSREVLGMNARNLDYIRPLNRRRSREFADNKLLSKRHLRKNGLPVPGLVARIRSHAELDVFDWETLPGSFALKPNRGFGGEGILIVYGRKRGRTDAWVKANGSLVTVEDLKTHIRNILDGSFSLTNTPDIAFFEERLKLLKLFKPYAYRGIPDIRVIVYNRVPVMAMLRLPTRESDGKANLQQGAIGIGIDLATGTTTTAVVGKSHIIEYVPKTRLALSGIRIPYWNEILRIAVESQTVSGLGFLGADIAIDRDRGPVLLELNARPGLSIQIANLAGLKGRLDRVKGLKVKTTERGILLGKNLFGGEIEEEIEELSGKRVIGAVEKVKLIGKDGKEVVVEAKIDTGADSTSIDTDLARELGFGDVIDFFDSLRSASARTDEEAFIVQESLRKEYLGKHEDLKDIVFVSSSNGISFRPKVRCQLILDSIELNPKMTIARRSHLQYPVIIGRNSLKRFLIDVNK